MVYDAYDISLNGISYSYGFSYVLRDFSAQFAPSEVTLVTGANGVGKTTLLKIIAGLFAHENGNIHIQDRVSQTIDRQQLCHWISAENPLKSKLTVQENLKFLMTLKTGKRPNTSSLTQALSHFNIDLTADKRVQYLSSGQRMRVFLSSLLLDDRPVWLLDEPSSHLDSSGRLILNNMIQKHTKKQNGIVIIATHDTSMFDHDQKVHISA